MTHKIEWIFFDIGSTLIDEEKADLRRIREMIAGTDITEDEYRIKRIEMIRKGFYADRYVISYFGLTKAPWHSEEEAPYPDAEPTLEQLKHKGFKLGLIANQNCGLECRLANWNLLQYFNVIAASAELGVAKPDSGIFRWALEQANCISKNALMVGDRLDNDIAPANRLGMHSVRLLRGLGAYQSPLCVDEIPEYTVHSLCELPHMF